MTVLYLEVPSFKPLDATQYRDEREIEVALPEEQRAYREARARDRRLTRAYYEALWSALRSYFGEEYLPPLALVEAYREGNERPYVQWDLAVDPDQTTSLCYDEDFARLYVYVDHGGHQDVLIAQYDEENVELFFRPLEGAHTDVGERLFRPLLIEFARRGLTPTNLQLLVAFIDDTGLHNAHLPVFLEQIGLR